MCSFLKLLILKFVKNVKVNVVMRHTDTFSRYISFRSDRSAWSHKNTKNPYYRYVDLTVQMRLLVSPVSERNGEYEVENQL